MSSQAWTEKLISRCWSCRGRVAETTPSLLTLKRVSSERYVVCCCSLQSTKLTGDRESEWAGRSQCCPGGSCRGQGRHRGTGRQEGAGQHDTDTRSTATAQRHEGGTVGVTGVAGMHHTWCHVPCRDPVLGMGRECSMTHGASLPWLWCGIGHGTTCCTMGSPPARDSGANSTQHSTSLLCVAHPCL